VTERQLNFQIKAPISFDQFWQLRTEMSETLREKMGGLAARATKPRHCAKLTSRCSSISHKIDNRKRGVCG
jgi:hypothetical protein